MLVTQQYCSNNWQIQITFFNSGLLSTPYLESTAMKDDQVCEKVFQHEYFIIIR